MEAKKSVTVKTAVKKTAPAKKAVRSATRTKTVNTRVAKKSTAKTAAKPDTATNAVSTKKETTKSVPRQKDTQKQDTAREEVAGSVKENTKTDAHALGDSGKDILDIGSDLVISAYGFAVKAVSSAKKPLKSLASKLSFRSNADELLKWTELYEKKVITREELESKKNKLI